jgi:hypothetical protein
MFGGISLGAAAIYYMMNLRNSARAQRSQLICSAMAMNTHREYVSGLVDWIYKYQFKDADEWNKKYSGNVDREALSTFIAVLNQLTYTGTLLHEDLVDPELLFRYFSPLQIVICWEKSAPIIKNWRDYYNQPDFARFAEYLYDEVKRRYPGLTIPSPEKRYWESSTKTGA